jgi:zinc/manganese transport system permease protein
MIAELVDPFFRYDFMQRALLGSLMLSAGSAPVGVFLTLRRMSLTGDAMSHAILPGAAIAYLFFGLQVLPMTIGALAVGLVVALSSGAVSRLTVQKEDASLAAFYLISLSLGVLLVSLKGSSIDLLNVLFGSILALDDQSLALISVVTAITLIALIGLWRGLVAECLDPQFLRSVSGLGPFIHLALLILVVLNLVSGFQALGSLLAVGLMILPAVAARFWSDRLLAICLIAIAIAMTSSVLGLALSYLVSLPSGPAVILCAGGIYLLSALVGPQGVLGSHLFKSAPRKGNP